MSKARVRILQREWQSVWLGSRQFQLGLSPSCTCREGSSSWWFRVLGRSWSVHIVFYSLRCFILASISLQNLVALVHAPEVMVVCLTSCTGVPCPSISGGVSPIVLSIAACSSETWGALFMLGPCGSGAFVASSLAKRCCKLGAARFWGTTRLGRNAIERALGKEIRGCIVSCTEICNLVLNTLSSSELPARKFCQGDESQMCLVIGVELFHLRLHLLSFLSLSLPYILRRSLFNEYISAIRLALLC